MIFVSRKNIWTPSRNWGRRDLQRGSILMGSAGATAAASGAIEAGAVTISGETGIFSITFSPIVPKAGVRVNSDGTIDKRIINVYTQIDSATDWIIPNGDASASYDVKATDNNANVNAGSDSTGVWIAMSNSPEWWVERAALGTDNLSLTIEMRFNGGSPLDSGAFTGLASMVQL